MPLDSEPGRVAPSLKHPSFVEKSVRLTKQYGNGQECERLSLLNPLLQSVDAQDVNRIKSASLFTHPRGGFDFVPDGPNHWTLYMSVEHMMQIWVCRSDRVTDEEKEVFRNTWMFREMKCGSLV